MNTTVAIVIALLFGILLGGVAIYIIQQNNRTRRLKQVFGTEYERLVAETGNRSRAEALLSGRQKRVHQLQIRELNPAERAGFHEEWREVQVQFVDDPNRALNEADRVIRAVMSAQGYPVRDFEQQAADISVDHSSVIENYHQGHAIALRNLQGHATTEDLRKAMIHYRALFEELAGRQELVAAERIRL